MKFSLDGEIFEAATYSGVVTLMAKQKMEPCSNKAYRRSAASRLNRFDFRINPETDESFIKSLEEAGILRPA